MRKRWGLLAAIAIGTVLISGCSPSEQGAGGAAHSGQTEPGSGNITGTETANAKTSGTEGSDMDEWPAKTITWYGASAGGTVDTNFRALAKVLEPHLGVSIVIVNDNNIISQDSMLKDKTDGYAYASMLLPDLYNYHNEGSAQHTREEFGYVANIISEPAAIAIHPDDERLNGIENLAELIEWCRANPDQNILCATGPVANNHDIVMRLLIKETGCENLRIINTDGGIPARKASFLGNNVDVYIGNAGDASTLAADGSAKILAVFGEERSRFLPDVMTAKEQGIDVVYGGHRGLVCSADVDPAVAAKMAEAIEWATRQPEYQEAMDLAGMETNLLIMEEYDTFAREQDELFTGLIPLFGW